MDGDNHLDYTSSTILYFDFRLGTFHRWACRRRCSLNSNFHLNENSFTSLSFHIILDTHSTKKSLPKLLQHPISNITSTTWISFSFLTFPNPQSPNLSRHLRNTSDFMLHYTRKLLFAFILHFIVRL